MMMFNGSGPHEARPSPKKSEQRHMYAVTRNGGVKP